MRSFLAFSLTVLLGLASANAYVAEQPQLPEQIEAAILLNEDGTPRCRVGSAPELDTLRECDEDDELYAEEISLGAAVPSGKMIVVILAQAGIMGVSGCILRNWVEMAGQDFTFWHALGGALVTYLPIAIIRGKILAGLTVPGLLYPIFGLVSGVSFIVGTKCNDANETTDNNDDWKTTSVKDSNLGL